MTTETSEYYDRLRDVLLFEIDRLLSEQDPDKKTPKKILEYLDMVQKCDEQITALGTDPMADWYALTPETQQRIVQLIEQDIADRKKIHDAIKTES